MRIRYPKPEETPVQTIKFKHMNRQLKKAIIDFVYDNYQNFQLVNLTIEKFRSYIYDNDGNYLIGGEEVSQFVIKAVGLLG